jgi:hypothetical protein
MKKLLSILLILFAVNCTAQAHVANGQNNYVFLLIGQSNMNGSAALTYQVIPPYLTNSNVMIWDGSTFPVISSTLNNNQYPTPSGAFGVELSFGYGVQNYTKGNVYLIKYAIGGTPLCNKIVNTWSPWITTTGLYTKSLDAYNAGVAKLNTDGIQFTQAGIIVYQGESDCQQDSCANSYATNFIALINRYRSDLNNPTLPVYMVRLHSGYDTLQVPYLTTLRAQQALACSTLTNCILINIDDLNLANGQHITYDAELILGRRIATALQGDLQIKYIAK